jgi:hypothetical protein
LTAPREKSWLARITHGGSFQREAHDGDPGLTGGGLTEQAVLRTASDHENGLEFLPCHPLEGAHGVGVAPAERVADEAHVTGEVRPARGEVLQRALEQPEADDAGSVISRCGPDQQPRMTRPLVAPKSRVVE